jgi:hypothetical protein
MFYSQYDENRDLSAHGENQRSNAFDSSHVDEIINRSSESYISVQDLSHEARIHLDLDRKRELARLKLVDTLAKYLGISLLATFLLMGLAAFNPSADKVFVKDLIPIVLGPQITLLSVIVGYYFGAKAN